MLKQRFISLNICLIILIHAVASEEPESHNFGADYYDDIDYDYGDYGDYNMNYDCHYHHNLQENHACHHDKFSLVKKISDKYNKNVRQCCGFHGYTFINNCKENQNLHEKKVCASPDHDPKLPENAVSCPAECQNKTKLVEDEFTIDNDGNLQIKNVIHKDFEVKDYCLSYECDFDQGWIIKAKVCVCPTPEAFDQVNKTVDAAIPRCCGNQPMKNANCDKSIEIIENETSEKCEKRFKEYEFEYEGNHILGKVFNPKGGPMIPKYNWTNEDDICVGPVWNEIRNNNHQLMSMHLFLNCSREPCDGKIPCIRTCCEVDERTVDCKKAENIPETYSLSNSIKSKFINTTNHSTFHFMKAPRFERDKNSCPKGYARKPYLNLSDTCNEDINFKWSENGSAKLVHGHKEYDESTFCLYFDKRIIIAEVCRKTYVEHRFKWYPYVFLTSSVFLMITFFIYTFYSKLLNFYTRVMRHYTLTMTLAFSILAMNQFEAWNLRNMAVCQFSAYAIQYLFLTSFTFMTAMSFELFKNLRGSPCNEFRYRCEVVISYAFPTLISIATMLMEFYAPKCSAFKPRFGEKRCFFATTESKTVWFYSPIMILLSINALMFTFAVSKVCSLSKAEKKLGLRSGDRNQNMEKFLLFVKLFIGMGFTWVTDIIGNLVTGFSNHSDLIPEYAWYVTDSINMLQGVYIFLIFVCKRNVIQTILGKGKLRKSRVTKSSIGMPLNRIRAKSVSRSDYNSTAISDVSTNTIKLSDRAYY